GRLQADKCECLLWQFGPEAGRRTSPCMFFAFEFVSRKYLIQPLLMAIEAVVCILMLYPQRNSGNCHHSDSQAEDIYECEPFVAHQPSPGNFEVVSNH